MWKLGVVIVLWKAEQSKSSVHWREKPMVSVLKQERVSEFQFSSASAWFWHRSVAPLSSPGALTPLDVPGAVAVAAIMSLALPRDLVQVPNPLLLHALEQLLAAVSILRWSNWWEIISTGALCAAEYFTLRFASARLLWGNWVFSWALKTFIFLCNAKWFCSSSLTARAGQIYFLCVLLFA